MSGGGMGSDGSAPEIGAIVKALVLIDEYLNLQPTNTRKRYSRVFRLWTDWVRAHHWFRPDAYFVEPRADDILAYLRHISDTRKLSESTLRGEVSALKSLYKWLFTNGHVRGANPWAIKLPKPQDQSRPVERLANADVRRLLECWGSSYDEILRRAVITLLFACGLRRSEACDLLFADVRIAAPVPHIVIRRQKNRTRSELPVAEWALTALSDYVRMRSELPGHETEAHFFIAEETHGHSQRGRQLSDTWIRRTFKTALKRCGLSADVYSCHSARVSAITKLLEDGVGHREVQEFSRHRSIKMVEKYDRRRFALEQNPGRQLKF